MLTQTNPVAAYPLCVHDPDDEECLHDVRNQEYD